MKIELIHLKGFKSVADVSMTQSVPFAVFVGVNGAGKSNLADGLAFFSAVVRLGVVQAMQEFGGFEHIHCFKLTKSKAKTASLELKIHLQGQCYHYLVSVHKMDDEPQLEERLIVDGQIEMMREKTGEVTLDGGSGAIRLPFEKSALMLTQRNALYQFLTNIKVFRFDPLSAKAPNSSSTDATALDSHGRNVATMLATLEENDAFRELVLQWIELLVPGMQSVATQKQRLDGSTVITFKEEGSKKSFPARLISDGTIYALCIMTAILSRADSLGLTIIEAPERGIHPKAITELVSLMRDNASVEHPVFVTTHSESVVRSIAGEELWLVNKPAGKTELKNAAESSVDLGGLNLDTAWLMNVFDGGLPW
jgi:predicted ATPase